MGWAISYNIPGYLPTTESAAFEFFDEALAYLLEELSWFEDTAATESVEDGDDFERQAAGYRAMHDQAQAHGYGCSAEATFSHPAVEEVFEIFRACTECGIALEDGEAFCSQSCADNFHQEAGL